ncbi:MAG: ATP-binding protein [Clostridiales bacterium]|nr:ATP-binding protein [Clostridiales bacterium]
MNIIEQITSEVGIEKGTDDCFDIMLMISEALTNAFKHGNKGNRTKPIYLRYSFSGSTLRIEVEDAGDGNGHIMIPGDIADDSILENNGRGLFIIFSLADKVEFMKNVMVIEKKCRKTSSE